MRAGARKKASRNRVGGAVMAHFADISPIGEAFDGLLSVLPGYGGSQLLQRTFSSLMLRSAPTHLEVRRIARALRAVQAQIIRRNHDDN